MTKTMRILPLSALVAVLLLVAGTRAAPQESSGAAKTAAKTKERPQNAPYQLVYDDAPDQRVLYWCSSTVEDVRLCKDKYEDGYKKGEYFFRAGDVVRLHIINCPLLSLFQVKINNEVPIQPALPFIRGVSDAQAVSSDTKTEAAAATKPLTKGAPVGLISGVENQLAGVKGSDASALKKAVAALWEKWKADEGYAPADVNQAEQTQSRLARMITAPQQPDYPGPSLQGIEKFAETLDKKWQALAEGPNQLANGVFALEVDQTQLLLQAVSSFNVLMKGVSGEQLSDTSGKLSAASAEYQSVRDSGWKLWQAAENSTAFKPDADKAVQKLAATPEQEAEPRPAPTNETGQKLASKPAVGEESAWFGKRIGEPTEGGAQAVSPASQDCESAADTATQLRCVVYITSEAASRYKFAFKVDQDWHHVLDQMRTLPDQINQNIASIFAKANSVYKNKTTSDDQLLVIKQWNGSVAAQIQIQETKGFQLFGLAPTGLVAPAPGAGQVTPTGKKSDEKKPKIVPATPSPVDPPAASDDSDANASAGDPQDSAGGNKNTKGKQDGGEGKAATGGEGSNQPQPQTIYQFSLEVHQFARANFVAGFARSWLKTRAYGLDSIPATDASGKPIVDSNGTPATAQTPVETKNQPAQYVYYVGIDFYLRKRDLFPATRVKTNYWIPGIMFAYGVNEEFNFLIGPNWETKWGLNLGGGVHFGQETGLPNGFGPPGTKQLPSTTTTAPTVQRFAVAPYISIGFDGSVFQKVFGAIKGAGGGSSKGGS